MTAKADSNKRSTASTASFNRGRTFSVADFPSFGASYREGDDGGGPRQGRLREGQIRALHIQRQLELGHSQRANRLGEERRLKGNEY